MAGQKLLVEIRNFYRDAVQDLKLLQQPGFKQVVNFKELVYFSLTLNLFSLAFPLLSLQVYDRILISKNLGTLYALFFGVFLIVLLELIAKICQSYIQLSFSSSFEHILSCNLFRKLADSNFKFENENENASGYMQKMENIAKLKEYYSGQAFVSLIDIPFVLLYISLIIYIGGKLSLIPISFFSLIILLSIRKTENIKSSILKKERKTKEKLNFIFESLEGIHTAKSLGGENYLIKKYEQMLAEIESLIYKENNHKLSIQNHINFITQLMTISLASYGAILTIKGDLTLGILIACILLSSRITGPFQKVFDLFTKLHVFRIYRKDMLQILNYKSDIETVNFRLRHNEGHLKLEKLSIVHNSEEIIANLDLELNKGDSIGILGSPGSPASVLLNAISGNLEIDGGKIIINGIESQKIKSNQLIQNLAHLDEMSTIFSGTIKENISNFGDISFEKANEVAKYLNLDQAIKHLPNGYNTKIEGNLADPISPGLKQRISIVRALANKPRIILFNHADKSLDNSGYNFLFQLLGKIRTNTIMIFVTEDKNLLNLANKECAIEKGKIVTVRENLQNKMLLGA